MLDEHGRGQPQHRERSLPEREDAQRDRAALRDLGGEREREQRAGHRRDDRDHEAARESADARAPRDVRAHRLRVSCGLRARDEREEDLRDAEEELVRQEREELARAVDRDPLVGRTSRRGAGRPTAACACRQEPPEQRDVDLHDGVREELRDRQRHERQSGTRAPSERRRAAPPRLRPSPGPAPERKDARRRETKPMVAPSTPEPPRVTKSHPTHEEPRRPQDGERHVERRLARERAPVPLSAPMNAA